MLYKAYISGGPPIKTFSVKKEKMSDRSDLILLQGAAVGIAGKNGARKTILVYNLYGLWIAPKRSRL